MGGIELLIPAAGAFSGFVIVVAICLRTLILEQARRLDEVKAHEQTISQLDVQIRLRREAEAREARAILALERANEKIARLTERINDLEVSVRDLRGYP
jgi:DNA repair exonuclease SbcCD ATPase subunit